MITVKLYSRQNCPLCDQARADLETLQTRIPHKLEEVDVDSNPKLSSLLGFEVPVVEVGPYMLKAPISLQELQMTLGAAQDRERHIDLVEKSPALEAIPAHRVWTRSDEFSNWLSHHYMAAINLIVAFYLGMSFMAPVLLKVGAPAPAKVIYTVYSFVCHQLAFRSFFLFGEQAVYPRQAAGVPGVMTLNQATGLSEDPTAEALYAARAYQGNPQVGFKVALCERDVAIYGGILLFGLLFAWFNFRFPGIPWYVWVVVGILPIAVDGVSQLISQPPFSFIPFRESTPFLRVLTGGLFGFFTAWFGYPMVEEGMADTRKFMAAKWQRLHSA